MRRRALLLAGLSLPLLGATGLELLRNRRARFEEVGDGVLMTVGLPELLSTRDDDAMASLELGVRDHAGVRDHGVPRRPEHARRPALARGEDPV